MYVCSVWGRVIVPLLLCSPSRALPSPLAKRQGTSRVCLSIVVLQ